MSGHDKTAAVLDALCRRHPYPVWTCIPEALSGWANSSTGGIDLLAVSAWGGGAVSGLTRGQRARHPRVAYEIKVSRSDFRKELRAWPDKAWVALEISDYFFFATPAGLLRRDEIDQREPWDDGCADLWLPEGVGLVEVDDGCVSVAATADRHEARELRRAEWHEVARRVADTREMIARVAYRERALRAEAENAALRETVGELLELIEQEETT